MPGVPPTRFVYLGPEGTFAEQALRTIPAAERGTRTPARSVPEALDAVRAGDADAAARAGGELDRRPGRRHPRRAGRGRATGDHPRGGAAGQRSCWPRVPGSKLTEITAIAAHPQASSSAGTGWPPTRPTPSSSTCSPTARPRQPSPTARIRPRSVRSIGAQRHRLTVLAEEHRRPRRRDDPVRAGQPARTRRPLRPATI